MEEIETSVPEITDYDGPLLYSTPAIVHTGVNIYAMLLGLLAGCRGPSLILSENAALQIKDYRESWGYTFPVVATETLWNLVLVVLSVVAMFWIAREETNVMLRVWICGYSVHCVVDVVLLFMKYMKRKNKGERVPTDPNASIPGMSSGSSLSSSSGLSSVSEGGDHPAVTAVSPISWDMDMLNTGVSCFWWVLGLIILMASYNNSAAPSLFWLTLAYLAMDVFFFVVTSLIFYSIP